MAAIPLERSVYYPESDGQPMGETPLHRREMSYLIEALEERFRVAVDVYISGNMFLYYERGRPKAVVAPDVFVARGVDDKDRERRTYKLWEEGVAPCLVIEVTSDATRDADLGAKKSLYERLGVTEYFLYDPLGDFIPERLRGFRLEGGRYFPFRLENDGSLASHTTGVALRLESGRVRVVDTATGRPYLRRDESANVLRAAEAEIRLQAGARRAAEEKARQEIEARQAAEAEIARLKAELIRLKGEA